MEDISYKLIFNNNVSLNGWYRAVHVKCPVYYSYRNENNLYVFAAQLKEDLIIKYTKSKCSIFNWFR